MDYLTSLPYEVQENILHALPDEDIVKYCKLNQNTRELCDDVSFWKERVRKLGLPDYLLNTENTSGQDRYLQLRKYGGCLVNDNDIDDCFRTALDNNDISILKYLTSKNPSIILILRAIDKLVGKQNINFLLNNLKDRYNELTPQNANYLAHNIANKLAIIGNVNNIIYIFKNILPTYNDYGDILGLVVKNNNLNQLKILLSSLSFDANSFNRALVEAVDNPEIFNYLLTNYPGDKKSLNLVSVIGLNPKLNLLKKLISYGFDNFDDALLTAVNDQYIDTVSYLLDIHDFSDEVLSAALDIAIRNVDLPMINQLLDVITNINLLNLTLFTINATYDDPKLMIINEVLINAGATPEAAIIIGIKKVFDAGTFNRMAPKTGVSKLIKLGVDKRVLYEQARYHGFTAEIYRYLNDIFNTIKY